MTGHNLKIKSSTYNEKPPIPAISTTFNPLSYFFFLSLPGGF